MLELLKKHIADIMSHSFQNRIAFWIEIFVFILSVLVLGAIVIDYGFVLDETETNYIYGVYDFAWWVYFILFTARLLCSMLHISRKLLTTHILLGSLFYLSAFPKLFGLSKTSVWFPWLWCFLESNYYIAALVGIFAVLNVSRGIVSFINKNTNPALLLAASFAVIIFVGTILLLVPRSTLEHIRLSVVDALFVSTSAVCVTGLTPVDIATTFTREGQIVIMLLIQIGGLGVMTITSFFAMFFMGNTKLYNQFALRDIINGSDTSASLVSMLLYILGFTFVIELIGAVFIWMSIHSDLSMTLHEELFFALFHSVSAFCNAGFSTMTGNLGNSALMNGGNFFYLTISLLVIMGGIGFPILVNFKNIIIYHLKALWGHWILKTGKHTRFNHLTNINTKIVLTMTFVLLAGGSIFIALQEWEGAFAGMSSGQKLTHAFFNAVVPRTAGFNSVELTNFSLLTLVIYIFLMWIGGASQSTAGGVKVNAFAVSWANFISVVRGRSNVVLFNRELAGDSVRRATAVVLGSITTILIFFCFLVALEPEITPFGLFFETVSALGTVGSSLNVTPLMGNESKVLISILMFIGRVGLITLLTSIVRPSGSLRYKLPKDNIIIN